MQESKMTVSTKPIVPLWAVAKKLTHPAMPAYQRCPSLVFPAWTKKRAITWTAAERKIPLQVLDDTEEYVAEFDKLNNLVHIQHVRPVEYREAA
jgi:hypothetical protein